MLSFAVIVLEMVLSVILVFMTSSGTGVTDVWKLIVLFVVVFVVCFLVVYLVGG